MQSGVPTASCELEIIFVVEELYGSLFGEPRVLAAGVNLSIEAKRFGAAPDQISKADQKRKGGESISLCWEQDQGDGVTAFIYWQTAPRNEE